tara:strand:- start:905 stop:1582 length:678 start_codon:yes stop_codon:yes gene_type:complete
MATNTVNGILLGANNFQIPFNAEISENTEASLTTDVVYTTTAQNAGDYGQGKVITHGLVTADNSISYAYILRQGLVGVTVPVAKKGVSGPTPALPKPWQLQPGDLLRVLTLTSAARNAALTVYTASGNCRIFIVTPSGGATQNFVDLQTGLSIGETLQGQRIVSACFTSVDGAKIETPGALIVSDSNNVVGSVSVTNPQTSQAVQNMMFNAPIALNYRALFLTNS